MDEVVVIDNSELVKSAAREQLIKALEEMGLVAEGYAKLNITEQRAVDTGLLRNSISHKVDVADKSVYIGTNVEYAPYIEYGTGKYAEKGNGRQTRWMWVDRDGWYHFTWGQRPRPYLRPAVSKHTREYTEIAKKYLKD